MAITTVWSVDDMTHKDADGSVSLVHWSLTAKSDGTPSYTAREGGKLHRTDNPSASDYITYSDLKESDVLSWVYDSLKTGNETATQAKKRIEDDRILRVQGQIDRAAANSSGVPW
jgi:hypothetical protein